ncbi:MAG: Rrf2 family transcriptional regulator [Rothia sp. (in: high G+C Gram-positive bacteria)]|nr:Rrf2 family transcriptional regulator [Rothia sp. (in: high G+C Gram-positive bacteria)]
MRLTAFSDVSLRIMMLLAGAQERKLSTQTIAQGVDTPYNHVAKSVAFLANNGWVIASRGRSGGVVLSDSGRKVTVGQILRRSERETPMVECESEAGACPMNHGCQLKGALARAREAFFEVLDPLVISELPNERQMGPVFVELGLGPLAQSQRRNG